mgnify:CR=1 FL=1
MNDFLKVQQQAQKKLKVLNKIRKDPRFQKVLGRLVKSKLLDANFIQKMHGRTTVEEALWAAQYEPRVMELLPGILLRKPKFFLQAKALPEDLQIVLRELRGGHATKDFRGIPAQKYKIWADRLGKRKVPLAIQKNYRLTSIDLHAIHRLKKKWKLQSETEILRKALQLAADSCD